MPLNQSIYATLFPRDDQEFDSSYLTPAWSGSPVFGNGGYQDTPNNPPTNPILDIMRRNSQPTTTNDQPSFTPAPRPQIPVEQPMGWDAVIRPRVVPQTPVTGDVPIEPEPPAMPSPVTDTTIAPVTPSNGKKIKTPKAQPPPFVAPYASLDPADPEYGTKNAINKRAQIQYDVDHPQNQDHGWKGFLKELAANVLYGIGQTPPGASVKQALVLGAVGGGAGAINRSWNERRAAEAQLPGATKEVDFQSGLAKERATTADILAKPDDRDAERLRKAAHDEVDAKYKDDLANLGALKAANLREYRKQIVELKLQGVKQTDQRIKALEKRIDNEIRRTDETIRHDQTQEELQKIREQGRNDRQEKAIGASAERQDKALGAAATKQDKTLQNNQAERHQKLDMWLKQKGMDGSKYFTYLDQAVQAKTMTPDAAARAKEDYNTMMRNP